MPKPTAFDLLAEQMAVERRRLPFKAWRRAYNGAILRSQAQAAGLDDALAVMWEIRRGELLANRSSAKRHPRDRGILPLITEGVTMVRSGEYTAHGAAVQLAERKDAQCMGHSKDALIQRLRKFIKQQMTKI